VNPEKMKITTHHSAADFLKSTRSALESNEAGNSLMLGICEQIVAHPERSAAVPCLKTVEDGDALVIAAMMTPPHKLVLYGHQGDIKTGVEALVSNLIAESWHIPGAFGPGDAPRYFAANWLQDTGEGCELERKLRVYALRKVFNTPLPEGRLRTATEMDGPLLTEWWYAFHQDVFGKADRNDAESAAKYRITQGDLFVWDKDIPVSMAMKTRPTRHGISISMVYTPLEFRGKGYATACVSALSQLLLDMGWEFCALFADLSNATSNQLYQRIGYQAVCDYSEYVCRKPGI
jgi:GNAT superfamily N-acetyltransferase